MNDTSSLHYILHVSDFHLGDDPQEVKNALGALTRKLKTEKLRVDYLVHTGDVIDSGDLYNKVAEEMGIGELFWENEYDEESGISNKKFLHDKYKEAVKSNTEQSKSGERIPQPNTNALQDFDNRVANYVQGRFKTATDVMNDFVTRLNIPFGNVIICSGNHDVLRPLSVDEDAVTCKKGKDGCWKYDHSGMAGKVAYYFNKFLNDLQTANCTDRCTNSSTCIEENCEACIECGEMAFCSLDDMNVLILNTNWPNPKKQQPGYYCVHCNHVLKAIRRHSEDAKDSHKLNVIIAHKPVYEICEKARLSF